jgi:hypothetical protein
MKLLCVVFKCGILLMLSSMTALAQSVRTDYDRSFNLAGLKTFGFYEQARRPGDPLAESPLNDRRIRTALDSELRAQGFSPSEEPDFLIAYHVTTRRGLDIQDNRTGIGPWDRWGNKQVTEGTLVVIFIDATTLQEVWRGLASGTIKEKDLHKDVNKSIAKLVRQFVKDQARKYIAPRRSEVRDHKISDIAMERIKHYLERATGLV